MPAALRTALARLAAAALTFASLSAGIAACSDPGTGPKPPDELKSLPRSLTADETRAVGAGNDFSFALLREVNATHAASNLFISPLSVSMALGMTMNGAAGETETAMRTTLGLAGQSAQQTNDAYRGLTKLLLSLDPSVKIAIANSIWYRQGFPVLPSFVDVSRTYFDAEVNAADFGPATVQRINDWAKAKTNGKIESVIQELDPNDMMVLMNALYYKGSWRSRFDPARTRPGPFHLDDGRTVSAPLMSQSKMPIRLGATDDGVTVGELPYGNGAFVMTVLLPKQGTTVDALVASLDDAKWERVLASLHDAAADVTLPRFRMKFEDRLNEPLTRMGMGIAFGDGPTDFTRLAAPPLGNQLYISLVKQSTFVDVNEEGTEAAAVTTVVIGTTSVGSTSSLVVDRPFVFALREKFSGAILFIGKVADPT